MSVATKPSSAASATSLARLQKGSIGGRASEPSQVNENWQPIGSCRALVDHAADRLREVRVAHPVDHGLGHRLLALQRLQRRFVVDRLLQAQHRAVALRPRGVQEERLRRREVGVVDGQRRVDRRGVGEAEVAERQRRRLGEIERRPRPWAGPRSPDAAAGSKRLASATLRRRPCRAPAARSPAPLTLACLGDDALHLIAAAVGRSRAAGGEDQREPRHDQLPTGRSERHGRPSTRKFAFWPPPTDSFSEPGRRAFGFQRDSGLRRGARGPDKGSSFRDPKKTPRGLCARRTPVYMRAATYAQI